MSKSASSGPSAAMDWETRIEEFQTKIAEDPHNAEYHKELGNAFHRTEQYELALEEYRTSLHIDPDYYPAEYNMGNTHWKRGDYYQAIICWQRALILNPELEHAIYNIAFAYYRLGTQELDREKSRRHLDNAVLEFKKAITLRPENTDSHLHLGLTWFELERFEDAVRQYHRVLELDPDDRYAHYNLGNVYYELGPRDPTFFEQALEEYRRSIEKNPEDQKSRNNIADCYLRLERYNDALAEIDQVLADNPNYIPARCTRGEIFSALDQVEDAIREFRLVIQLDPEEHRVLHRYVSHQLLELYNRILHRDGSSPATFYNLARACRDIGVSSGDRSYMIKARDIMRHAIQSLGSEIPFHLLLGEVYLQLRHFDYALLEAERCLSIDADFIPAHALLNEIYIHTGQRDLALQEVQLVRKLLGSQLTFGEEEAQEDDLEASRNPRRRIRSRSKSSLN